MGLDLVEISPNADPPVCKVIDYKKFIYDQKKKKKAIKAKSEKVVIKEIRFGPNTEEHDFNFKLNHAKKFLKEGCKVKAFVFFKFSSFSNDIFDLSRLSKRLRDSLAKEIPPYSNASFFSFSNLLR